MEKGRRDFQRKSLSQRCEWTNTFDAPRATVAREGGPPRTCRRLCALAPAAWCGMRATDEESASKQRKDLAEPLIANGASAPKPGLANSAAARRSAVDWDTVVGMAMVTSAALLFGVVAAFVKACSMPTLVMLQCRSIIEWFIGIAVAIAQLRGQKPKPMPQADAKKRAGPRNKMRRACSPASGMR